jgi:hypothetical protein
VIDGTAYTRLSSLFQFQWQSDQVNVLAIVVAVDKGGSLYILDRSWRAGIIPTAVQGITLGTGEGKTNKQEAAVDSAGNIAEGDCLLLHGFFVGHGDRMEACLYGKGGAETWCIRKPKSDCCAKCCRRFSEREVKEIEILCDRWSEGWKETYVSNMPIL